jgi:hypothetical protein
VSGTERTCRSGPVRSHQPAATHGSRRFLAALENGLSAFSPPLKNRLLRGWHRVPKRNQLHSNRTWKANHRPGAMRDVKRCQLD